jgi:nicotinic acid phosphoribosyltransferase
MILFWGFSDLTCVQSILKTLHFNDLILVNNAIFLFPVLSLDDVLSRYKAGGIRLDSGDLAYLSCEARKFFYAIEKEFGVLGFGKMGITASNDLNEETLDALNKQVIFC